MLEWREIPGFPGYEISNLGDVRSSRPWGARGTPAPKTPRPLKSRLDKDGYKRVTLMLEGKEHPRSVARLVCEAWNGAPFDGAVVRHLDGSKANNTPANLAWGTQAENVADALRHGTQVSGSRVHKAKLNEDSAREIYLDPRANSQIAKDFGVTPGAVWFIKTKRSWVKQCRELY